MELGDRLQLAERLGSRQLLRLNGHRTLLATQWRVWGDRLAPDAFRATPYGFSTTLTHSSSLFSNMS